MTTFYFVQHGIACSSDVDTARPLTDQGRAQVSEMARHLAAHRINIKKICHSGKLRAQQTAELFAAQLNCTDVTVQAGMKPNDDPATFIDGISNEDAVMYVGHLPHLDRVVSLLLSGNGDLSLIKFQNAAVACVEKLPDRNCLNWYMITELL